jgi:dolichyl-phosphate-mannose--protein O-mannosyl transferase
MNAIAPPTLSSLRADLRVRYAAYAAPLLVLIVAAVTHFIYFDRPLTVVFDEVYFPRFALSYLKHEYFLDLHPPLGKLILFVTAWLAGLDPGFSFATNQLPFPDPSYLWLRVPPRIAGTLLPLVLYGVARELALSRWAAFAVGMFAALDNGLLVMSRLALLDSFLLLFGFGALWCYLRACHRGWTWPLVLGAALAGGAAVSVKWTGLSFVALILLLEGVRWLRERTLRTAGRALLIATIAAAVYIGTFAVHFALADRSGRDDAAMTPAFQATLQSNPHAANPALERPGFIAKTIELHRRIFENTRNTRGPHAYASRWYDWPFMMRAVDFWAEHKENSYAHIYMLGNPAVWWIAGYGILFLLVNFPPKLAAWAVRARPQVADRTETFVVLAYLVNVLPFVLIGRIMFLYHYLAALCVALLALGYLLDRTGRYRGRLAIALLALAAAGFVYFAPLTYGLPLAPADFDARFWVKGWR